MKKLQNNSPWKFTNAGGVVRVSITSGKDIKNISQLDDKMWSVLSMPVKGVEFDENTLKYMDTDADGRVRVYEVKAATDWITSVLKNADILLKNQDSLNLDEINQENEEGKKLYKSAAQILKNLGLDKQSISIADTSDSIAIFAKTVLNGDGVIIPDTASENAQKEVITACISTIGSTKDLSGIDGVNADQIEAFYDACTKYNAWIEAGKADKSVFPYGENTGAALAAYDAIKDKVNDYFTRCRLAAYNSDAQSPLDVSAEQFLSITTKNLSECSEEIAAYPLARISAVAELPLESGINPAWTAAVATFKSLVIDIDFPKAKTLTVEQWATFAGKFAPYRAWLGKKDGAAVESLGADAIAKIVKEDNKQALLDLVAKDKELESEAKAIADVDKMLHYVRDIYTLLKNYVTFVDFYNPDKTSKALFQAGVLYIDQRSCELCVKVSDMGKQAAQAGASGMYLVYCDCTSKVRADKMTIVAAVTAGDVNNLYVGKNAIFYDRDGVDWDAVVTKIIDNPISISQAFWTPYKKFAKFIEDSINKFAASQDSKVTSDVTSSISSAGTQMTSTEGAAAAKSQAFDIAKFAGIFAAIGMAIGYIGGFLVSVFKGFVILGLWQMILALLGVLLLISSPSMIMAAIKLHKRNLSPVLNANGWAMNSSLLVRIPFGNTLTQSAKFPKLNVRDVYEKSTGTWWKVLLSILVILMVVVAILYFTGLLNQWGVPYHFLKPLKFWA